MNTPITTPWFVPSSMLAPFSANILRSVHVIQLRRWSGYGRCSIEPS